MEGLLSFWYTGTKMIKIPRYLLSAILVFLLLISCDNNNEFDDLYPVAADQELNIEEIVKAFNLLSEVNTLNGIALGKHGKIAAAKYFNDTGRDDLHDVRSVTKSVMGLLTGIAINEGDISGKYQTLRELMPGRIAPLTNSSVGDITIENILTMSSGLEWHELDGGNSYGIWYWSDDPIHWVLNQDVIHEPGDGFNYNTGSIHLLSSIITSKTGQTTLEYAQEHIFDPMGVDSDWTSMPPDNYLNNGGAGLKVSIPTLFKIGTMMLDAGVWEGEQLIPVNWAQQSITFQNVTHSSNPYWSKYGYLWWIGEAHDMEYYFASGYGGQFILCVPELDFVVVTAADWSGLGWDAAGQNWYDIIIVLIETILPAAS